ncbi:MAG: glycosyltransferase [Victivallaceae bacterium]|nr:glycosyltransferase [Victivallaceae bacterium]
MTDLIKMNWGKYLNTKAAIAQIEPIPKRHYDIAVVIPVYAEAEFIDEVLTSLAAPREDILIVAVINHPSNATAEELENNHRVAAKLRQRNIPYIAAGELTDGVGEARKIGMDSVLPYLTPHGLICCLDADSPVENNYFSAIEQAFTDNSACAGAVVAFCHSTSNDQQINRAIIDYELWLRYYVYALEYAGSPYAFFTVGSTIITRANAYVKAGGMRKRPAAEDFYFLQALSKVGTIISITETMVYPSPRPSPRVPFGTGRKVGEVLDGGEIKLYHPTIFNHLKAMFDQADQCSDFSQLAEIFIQTLSIPTLKFLENNHFADNWSKIYRNTAKNDSARRRAFHIWFDAFRTLKFVHFCETEYPEQFARCEILPALSAMVSGMKFNSKPHALEYLRNIT